MTRSFETGISTKGSIAISGPNSPITLNGLSGSGNQVLTSTGTGTTPVWAAPVVNIDQTALYEGHVYTSVNNYALSFTGSVNRQSILGSTTRGFQALAGNTYEIELYFMVGMSYVSSTTMSLNYGWDFFTITGSPTQSHAMFLQTSTSTILGAQGSSQQSRTSGGASTIVTPVTTGSRYASIITQGTVRVNGTGSMRIVPGIGSNNTGDNGVTVYSNLTFKVRRVGDNGVTTIGTWTT